MPPCIPGSRTTTRQAPAALSAIGALEKQRANGLEGLRQAYWSYALISKKADNLNGAIVFAKLAVNIQQEIRAKNAALPKEQRGSLSERYRDLYNFLAEQLIEAGRLQEAQYALDLIKRQEVFEFVRGDAKVSAEVEAEAGADDTRGGMALTPGEAALSAKIEEELKAASAIAAGAELAALNRNRNRRR